MHYGKAALSRPSGRDSFLCPADNRDTRENNVNAIDRIIAGRKPVFRGREMSRGCHVCRFFFIFLFFFLQHFSRKY